MEIPKNGIPVFWSILLGLITLVAGGCTQDPYVTDRGSSSVSIVEGIVRTPEGEPLEGVEVQVRAFRNPECISLDGAPWKFPTVRTNSEGRFMNRLSIEFYAPFRACLEIDFSSPNGRTTLNAIQIDFVEEWKEPARAYVEVTIPH